MHSRLNHHRNTPVFIRKADPTRRARLGLISAVLSLRVVILPLSGQVPAADQRPTQGNGASIAPEAGKPEEPARDPVLKLDKFVVQENNAGASSVFADRTSTDGLTDVIRDDALKNPNASSASELLQGVPGVTVARDVDGGTKISVRGLDSRFVQVTVDGQRQRGSRNPLDSVAPESIRSLEVTKAITPDMDADAIGGAINVVTNGAADLKRVNQGRHQLTYNTLAARLGSRNSLSFARPLALFSNKPDTGIMVSFTYDDSYRRRESIESESNWPALVSPGPGSDAGMLVPVFARVRLDATDERRQRSGLVFNADTRFPGATFFLRSGFNRDESKRIRRRLKFDVSEGLPLELTPDHAVFGGVQLEPREQRETSTRDQSTLSVGGRRTGEQWEWDGSAGLTVSTEEKPQTLDTVFRSAGTYRTGYDIGHDPFAPRFSFVGEASTAGTTGPEDPAGYQLDSFTISDNRSVNRDFAALLNAKLKFGDPAQPRFVKLGAKVQQRRQKVEAGRRVYLPSGTRSMAGLVSMPSVDLASRSYRIGPIPDSAGVNSLRVLQSAQFVVDEAKTQLVEATGGYQVRDSIWAAYAMAQATVERWTFLGGARIEATRAWGRASQVTLDSTGRPASVLPAIATAESVNVLPGLHVRFVPQPNLVLRAAFTRALARPSYGDWVPRRTFNLVEQRISSGNPDLQTQTAANYDLALDFLSERMGAVSLAIFAKQISRFIVESERQVAVEGLGVFREGIRRNGSTASVRGLELGWKSNPWILPSEGGRANLALTYTLLHSAARVPARPGEVFPLPDQADHQITLALQYQRGPMEIEINARHRTAMLKKLVAPQRDIYEVPGLLLDASASWKLSKAARVSLGLANLLSLPGRAYMGDRRRLNEYEAVGLTATLGVQWKL